jgi:hypothetical protein
MVAYDICIALHGWLSLFVAFACKSPQTGQAFLAQLFTLSPPAQAGFFLSNSRGCIMSAPIVAVMPSPADSPDFTIQVSDAAAEAVRLSFNPSGIDTVHIFKALAGAFLTLADAVAQSNPSAARELAVAKTNMQTASMWAVLGTTKNLVS